MQSCTASAQKECVLCPAHTHTHNSMGKSCAVAKKLETTTSDLHVCTDRLVSTCPARPLSHPWVSVAKVCACLERCSLNEAPWVKCVIKLRSCGPVVGLGLWSGLKVGVMQGSMSVKWCLRLQGGPQPGGLSPGSPLHPLLCSPPTCIASFR